MGRSVDRSPGSDTGLIESSCGRVMGLLAMATSQRWPGGMTEMSVSGQRMCQVLGFEN